MKTIYESKINNMISNYEAIKKEFKWEEDLSKHLIALNYTIQDKEIDTSEVRDLKDYVKDQTKMFSIFRGQMMFALCGLLCAGSDTPKLDFDFMLENESVLKSVGFKNSMYLPTALYALLTVNNEGDINRFASKAKDVYREMKDNHPFLTSGDDYALAILLASSNYNPDLLETYYKALNSEGFTKSNGLQMLSHIMSLGGSNIDVSVDKAVRIYNELKNNKLKVFNEYYSAIGLVSLLDNQDEVIKDLIDVANYLRSQKKHKWLGKGMNILMASAIVASEHVKNMNGVVSTTLTVSIQAIIAAQQAAMIAAIAATTAATTST